MLTIVISIAILCLIYLSVCYFIYRFAFHAPDSHQNDPYFILNGKSDQAQKDLLFPLITELLEKPFEEVHIKALTALIWQAAFTSLTKTLPSASAFTDGAGSVSATSVMVPEFCLTSGTMYSS